jgi:sugar lactone lactonase YvrE
LNNRIVGWKPNAINGQIIAGENGEENQLFRPTDFIVDKENNFLIIAEEGNRRVVRWSLQSNTNEQIIISDIDCWGLTMDKDGSLYVSDYQKNEVRRWKIGEKDGTIVAGGNGQGDQLNQFNYPNYIFIDENYSLYVSDKNNGRVMKWEKDAKQGIVVAGGNSPGTSLMQLYYPQGLIVDELGQIYVADCLNSRVLIWRTEADEGVIVVGGNGRGEQSNQFFCPTDLSFDGEGNLYVLDSDNARIQIFEFDLD